MISFAPVENSLCPVENKGLICGNPVESVWNSWGKLWLKIRIANLWKSQEFLNICKWGKGEG
jgi:hypothetical protein